MKTAETSLHQVRIFIESEAGSDQKRRYDSATLERLDASTLARPYPFPYGFILDTRGEDGDNVDCYVITSRPLRSGRIVTAEPVGMLEQVEDGEIDHKILLVLPGDNAVCDDAAVEAIRQFIYRIFAEFPSATVEVGKMLGADVAEAHIRASAT